MALFAFTVSLSLAIAVAQRCSVQEFPLCHDLCDQAIRDPVVKGVYFSGLLANVTCLPDGVEVKNRFFPFNFLTHIYIIHTCIDDAYKEQNNTNVYYFLLSLVCAAAKEGFLYWRSKMASQITL